MTDPRQCEREQQARGWLDWYKSGLRLRGVGSGVDNLEIEWLVALIKATEAAAIEEVAKEMERHPYWSREAYLWIKHLRQQAQERAS